jgi:hypothetical protein
MYKCWLVAVNTFIQNCQVDNCGNGICFGQIQPVFIFKGDNLSTATVPISYIVMNIFLGIGLNNRIIL